MSKDAFIIMVRSANERRWASNEGYEDQPTRFYEFDSTVKNGSNLTLGTRVFVKEDSTVIGSGVISAIDTRTTEKVTLACPKCLKASLGKTKDGFTCTTCKEHFDEDKVIRKAKTVVATRVWYKNTWAFAGNPMSRLEAEKYLATKDLQSAIRRVRKESVSDFLTALGCSQTQNLGSVFNFS